MTDRIQRQLARNIKIADMLQMYCVHGMDTEDIAKVYGCTRQYVSLVLRESPTYVAKTARRKDLVCSQCSGTYSVIESKPVGDTNFCSKQCRSVYKATHKRVIPIEVKREKWRIKMNKYYHNVLKNRPDFKEKVRRYNQNQKEKRKVWWENRQNKLIQLIKETIKEQ